MFLMNVTAKDLTLCLDTKPYVFPAQQPPPPAVEGQPPEKPVAKVVEIGDPVIADHLQKRTFHAGSRRKGTVMRYDLVAFDPKSGVKFEVCSRHFLPVAKPPPAPFPSIHSFTKRQDPRTPDQQPRPPDVVMADVRKGRIASISFTQLKREAVRRGLCKNADRIDKPACVDRLYESGFDPAAMPE